MARVLVLGRLKLLAQRLRLVDHVRVVLVHPVEQTPVLRELGERRGAQDEVEERGGAGAVHVAGANGQLVLQVGDLLVRLVDLDLLGLHGRLRGVPLVDRFVVVVGGSLEVGLQPDELVAHRVGLCLLFGSRLRERRGGSHQGSDAECDGAAEKRPSVECDDMLAHARSSSIEHVVRRGAKSDPHDSTFAQRLKNCCERVP